MPGEDKAALNFTELFSKMASIFKALPADKLKDLKDVGDMWSDNEEHSNLSSGDMLFGPSHSMRGGHAQPMNRQHSDSQAQEGTMRLYEQLDRMLPAMKAFSKAQKAQAEAIAQLMENQQAVFTTVETMTKSLAAKAETPADTGPGEDSFLGLAHSKMEKARKAYRAYQFTDEGERDVAKSKLGEAETLLKSALKFIAKAEDDDDDDDEKKAKNKDKWTEKALSDQKALAEKVRKAQADIKKADDEDEEERKKEETKKAEAEAAAKKAEEEAAAAAAKQAAGGDAGGGNAGAGGSSDTGSGTETSKGDVPLAAQIAEMEKIHKAIEAAGGDQAAIKDQVTMLTTTVKGVMDLLSNMPKNSMPPSGFHMIKSETIPTLEERIAVAKDNGTLATTQECTLADSLMQRAHRANAGSYPRERLAADIDQAPESVRNLFKLAA